MHINYLLLSLYFPLHMLKGVKNEGWCDPWMLLRAFKKKVLSMGVHFMNGEVTGVTVEDNEVKAVQVQELVWLLHDK